MLADEPLRRELHHLYETRWDTLTNGSESAFETHTARMQELEREFLRRFPAESAPHPLRTRAGRRKLDAERAAVEGGTPEAMAQSTTSQSRQHWLRRRRKLRA
jgi:hypothetical protein